MTDEYIRKQDAVKASLEFIVEYLGGAFDEELQKGLKNDLESLKPADVVPVVRCKDCRKCIYDSLFDQLWCNMTPVTRRVKPDDFCSYGERREEQNA